MPAKKRVDFNLVVIGSGLSSLSFIDSYLEKNKKIDEKHWSNCFPD